MQRINHFIKSIFGKKDYQHKREEDVEAQENLLPVKEEKTPNTNISTKKIIKDYATFIYSPENRKQIHYAAGLTAVGTALNFIAPYILGAFITTLTNEKDDSDDNKLEQITLLFSLHCVYLLTQFIPNTRDRILVPVSSHNTEKLLTKITEHQLHKSLNYHINTPQAEQIYLFQKGFSVADMGTPLLTKVAPTLLEMTIAVVALSKQYGPAMGLGLSTLFSIYTAYCAVTTQSIIDARELMVKAGPKAWDAITAPSTRYKTIHDFNKIDHTMKNVVQVVNMATNAEMKSNDMPLKIGYGHMLIPRAGMLLALLYLRNQLSIAEFIALFGYLNQLCSHIPDVGRAMNTVFSSFPDLKFVFNELAKPPEIEDKFPDKKLTIHTPSIRIENLHFGYPDKTNVFNGITLDIQSGETVALVSESGGGKSTLFNLLYGYYTASSGQIYINNQNITEVSRSSLQKNIGLVGQNANLFNGTVRENILFGAKDSDIVNDSQIFDLAKKLNLAVFICGLSKEAEINQTNFSKGLDTDVGENGKALSGGQQQKIAILRGFLKDSPIRLLDEVTASLDAESASTVLSGIKEVTKNTTTIVITHHLAEITSVNRIFVLDQGKIIAEGTHEELLKNCALYKNLWAKQNKTPIKLSLTNHSIFKHKTLDRSNTAKLTRSLSYSPGLSH